MAPILSHFPLLKHASALLAKISAQSWEGVSHSQALSLLDGLAHWVMGNKFLKARASQFPWMLYPWWWEGDRAVSQWAPGLA